MGRTRAELLHKLRRRKIPEHIALRLTDAYIEATRKALELEHTDGQA